jgi:hypothetical protein
MKYSLHIFLLATGMVSLVGVGLIWIPATYAYHYFFLNPPQNPVETVLTGAFVVGVAGFLLWVVREAWREIVRLRTVRKKQKRREAIYEQFPSWDNPPPLPKSKAPAPTPPKP